MYQFLGQTTPPPIEARLLTPPPHPLGENPYLPARRKSPIPPWKYSLAKQPSFLIMIFPIHVKSDFLKFYWDMECCELSKYDKDFKVTTVLHVNMKSLRS